MSDGRWRVIGTHVRFSEPDEQRAIIRFREMTANATRQAHADDLADRVSGQIRMMVNLPEFWEVVADELHRRPQWVAKMTGIEQLGYLRDVKRPEALPSLAALATAWRDHCRCSNDQRQKITRAWQDFCTTTRIGDLRDITPETVIKYQDAVYDRGHSGKQQSHLFSGIRTMLRFCRKRAIAPVAIAAALENLTMLAPSETATSIDPKPIERAEWDKLLAAAGTDDRAMILLMLNGAFYAKEVINLEWSDIDNGCITTHRKKTGKCVRVCALWPETLAALQGIGPREPDDKLFYNYAGKPITISGAQLRFNKLAKAAGVNVTASQLRDGAYSAAAAANVSTAICALLVGHRSGMADHYVKRNSEMVRPATDAIYKRYMSPQA